MSSLFLVYCLFDHLGGSAQYEIKDRKEKKGRRREEEGKKKGRRREEEGKKKGRRREEEGRANVVRNRADVGISKENQGIFRISMGMD